MDGIKTWIKDMLLGMDSKVEYVAKILSDDWFAETSAWYKFAMGMHTVIMPIALMIITICFLLEFLKITMQMDVLKWEYALKCFFKLVFAKVCIDLSTFVLSAIYVTAAEWIVQAGSLPLDVGPSGSTTSSLGFNTWKIISTEVNKANLLGILGIFISVGIVFIAINAIMVVVQVMAFARQFEICIYVAIAPLPCSFLPLEDGGMARIPKKYFLTVASSCLAGLFMIMSIKLYELLATQVIQDKIDSGAGVGGVAGELLLASLILVIAVIKSGSWASKILDVG